MIVTRMTAPAMATSMTMMISTSMHDADDDDGDAHSDNDDDALLWWSCDDDHGSGGDVVNGNDTMPTRASLELAPGSLDLAVVSLGVFSLGACSRSLAAC
jgi:hypothetical protein